MKYFDVVGENADGTPNTLNFEQVSEWSFKGLEGFFAQRGVILSKVPGTTRIIDDKPVYYKDATTEEILLNTGQVI